MSSQGTPGHRTPPAPVEQTPQTPVAFKAAMVALAKHLPARLGELQAHGRAIRAKTHTTRSR